MCGVSGRLQEQLGTVFVCEFSPTWTCSPRTAESPSSGSAGGVFIVTDFSERLSLLRDLWRSRLRSLKEKYNFRGRITPLKTIITQI